MSDNKDKVNEAAKDTAKKAEKKVDKAVEAPETKTEAKKEKKDKAPAGRKERLIAYVVAIVAILILTNPGLIPFLPKSIGSALTRVTSGLFGDVTKIVSVVQINWVSIFQLVLMFLMILIIREIVTWIMEKVSPKTNRGKTIKNLIESSMQYLFTLVGIFWGLSIIGVNISTIFASLGIVALIIGFGAESLIADVVTGLFMIFENHYNVGDVIELDGFRGTIVNIAIRTTSVEDAGGNIKVFNNSDMRNIINYSSDMSRAICDMPIPYEADIEKAEAELEKLFDELVAENPEVFKNRPTYSGVQQLADSAVILRIVAEVEEDVRFKAARIMNRKFKIGLEKAGMGCPYNQIVVHKAE